jgi:hypothetical protein
MRLISALALSLLAAIPLSLMGAGGCGGGNGSEFGNGNPGDDGGVGGGDGPVFINGDGSGEAAKACTGLCQKQVQCGGGKKTTISGTVWDPGGNVKLYNVVVYVPNAPVGKITNGATCDKCGSSLSGDPLVATLTDANGHFSLENVPVTDNMPVVIQVGKWRRQIIVPHVAMCADTPLPDKNMTRLPRNAAEGDIPLIALTTGGADTLECLLGKNKIGLDDSVFSTAGGPGRVHFYQGLANGGNNATTKFNGSIAGGVNFAQAQPFWSDAANLKKYDIVLLSCEGDNFAAEKPAPALDALKAYTTNGGRVFASHWHNYWFTQRFASTGPWNDRANPADPTVATVDTSFPKGMALRDWLVNNGSATPGKVSITQPRHNLDSPVTAGQAQSWLTMPNSNEGGKIATEYMSFNTPIGVPVDQQCGRAVYSDLHVGSDTPGSDYPSGCTSVGLTEQEKVLEFMLFDLSACISNDSVAPPPPVK